MNARKIGNVAIAIIVGFGTLFESENFWTTANPANFVSQAEARIGRPLTPFSVAGVARRTTRRAVWAGAAVGALGYGYGYGYPSYGYGYPSYSYPSYSYGYSYPSYSYGYSYPSYSYGYRSPYYASYGYRGFGLRRGWW
jgi:hypothetical protein